ncbi:unnamed protein product [Rhizoctonia solani]|uniref:Uncharacterized protein n=3 Tax=Rhizoctonia solani TaxID=456999 RepID=A0A8H2XFV4_9AGAM|nr:arylesterase domain protein [Rhizoctonia solani AG-3 Rhs1AP]KEP53072.1 arylesterase domain protein [Rhizoctonia solani 123E]CAE6425593.1 unnamed protein product [Rhizoctonia solani]CAE6505548.1 unnamed protein product [Rhizoctonia solani]
MVVRGLSIVVALLAWYAWNLKHAIQAQLFPKNLPRLFSAGQKCELVENNRFKFCEDGLVYAPGISVFSCDPGRHEWNTVMGPMRNPSPRGGLWALHYNSTTTQQPYFLELTHFPADADFHPLGIEITPADSTGTSRLLVVNHRRENSTIEVFHIRLDQQSKLVTLEHETTLTDRAFVAPNAMTALSPHSFIVSQDHYFTRRMAWPLNILLPPLETFLVLPLGRVDLVTFDPLAGVRQVQTIARNIPFANGVAISEDKSTLAIASTTRAEVRFYSLRPEGVKWVSSVRVPFSVDNIAFAGDRLLAAGHPYLPEFMALVKRKSNRAPSYVVEITPRAVHADTWLARSVHPDGMRVRDVFTSDGSFLSSSSGAFMDLDAGAMFVVALYGEAVAKCSLA